MKKTTLGDAPNTFLASATDATELTPEQIDAVKKAGAGVSTSLSGLEDVLDEPLRGQFVKVKTDLNTMLAKLAPTDMVPAANQSGYLLNSLLWMMSAVQSTINAAKESISTSKNNLLTAQNSVTGRVEEAINAKVKTGELLKKEDVDAKVNTAVNTAKETWNKEQKTLADRRTALNTAGLPIPADDKLAGTDDEFKARQDTAKTRAEALKAHKLANERLITLCWGEQSTYDIVIGSLGDIKPAVSPGTANGFIGTTNKTPDKTASNLNKTCC